MFSMLKVNNGFLLSSKRCCLIDPCDTGSAVHELVKDDTFEGRE